MTSYLGFSNAICQTAIATGVAITTVWLPLPTAYPYIDGCSANIYKPAGGNIFAWDPLFGATIRPAATGCLPRELTSSYWQDQLSQTAITTLLGPTFVCPAAYSAVLTLAINSQTQQILCCPSSFKLNVPLTTGGFPSQCVSSISAGQVLTYLTAPGGAPSADWKTAIVTPTAATSMLAIHVNGFNVLSTSSSSSSKSTSPSTSFTSATSSSTSSSSPSSTATPETKSSGLSTGAAAGIGVGAAAIVILAALAVFLLFRRRRKAKDGSVVPTEDTSTGYYGGGAAKTGPPGDYDPWTAPRPPVVPNAGVAHEMETSAFLRGNEVSELPVKQVRYEMGP